MIPSFLGQGILRPFRRDEKNDFANAAGAKLVKARVGQVLGTKANSARGPGELAWRAAFGSRLHLLRHANHSAALDDLATVYVTEALRLWEPAVAVRRVELRATTNARVLELHVSYDIVDPAGRVVHPNQEAVVAIPTEG